MDTGIEHPFGQPTKYELVHDGKRYPPKAVVGLSFKHFRGQILGPEEFSGGEAPGQANYVLRRLGFTVSEITQEDAEKPVPKDWSEQEVRLIVVDYFEMLELELLGKSFSKADHRKSLIPLLDGRSNPSIEYKHSNISAVLTNLGFPYIEGYKPRGNYQALLGQEVEAFLDQRPGFLEQLANAPVLNPEKAPETSLDLEKIIEAPPESMAALKEGGKPWLSRKGCRIDFAERDAANRHLAKLGEQFVVQVEQHRLRTKGRDDLAGKVEWVSQTIGDGLGFDVRSFDEQDDSEKLVEVKTTGNGKFFPFYVTRNEVRCSEDMTEKFHLFRVFDFARMPRVYILTGSLRATCQLEPIQFRATV
jgi:hypothetical protein